MKQIKNYMYIVSVTCLCNKYPFYIGKMGFAGVYLFFLSKYLKIIRFFPMKFSIFTAEKNLYMSHHMGKPTICIGENEGADQLRSNCEVDQRLCFRYSDSTVPLLFVPRLFEEKRRDIVFGFPSFCPSVRPPIGVCTLCAQLLLQFYSDSFETLQMSSSCFEDVHVVWI